MNKKNTRNGNALLIALLLTSILILITVGLSRLISSETRQIASLIRNARAEYLAEAGTEVGQLLFANSAPGFEKSIELNLSNLAEDEKKVFIELVSNHNHIPILPSETIEELSKNNTFDEDRQKLFTALLPGESVEIPLTEDTKKFEIQYYLPTINDASLENYSQADLNVLLFKLSGNQINSNFGTDSEVAIDFLTAYLPAGKPLLSQDNNIGKSPLNPARIQTSTDPDVFYKGQFFEYSSGEINPSISNGPINPTDLPDPTVEVAIEDFLRNHTENIIVMSNAINLLQINFPSTNSFGIPYQTLLERLGTIWYRVCTPSCGALSDSGTQQEGLIAPTININSTGVFQGTLKNVTTQLSRKNALSVFDFALYRTDTNTSVENQTSDNSDAPSSL